MDEDDERDVAAVIYSKSVVALVFVLYWVFHAMSRLSRFEPFYRSFARDGFVPWILGAGLR